MLMYIAQKFRDTGAAKIADIGHEEPAGIDNYDDKKIISFFYAFDLKMV